MDHTSKNLSMDLIISFWFLVSSTVKIKKFGTRSKPFWIKMPLIRNNTQNKQCFMLIAINYWMWDCNFSQEDFSWEVLTRGSSL